MTTTRLPRFWRHPSTLGSALFSISMAAAAALPLTAANAADAALSWSSLDRQQQAALAPLANDWASLDAVRRSKWVDIASRLPSMAPAERERMQQRMAEWARMSPHERAQARVNFQEARQLSPGERQSRWDSYQSLPAEERRGWADRSPPAAGRKPPSVDTGKSNVVPVPGDRAAAKAVAPTMIQGAPGATTTLISRPATPPLHQQPGLPKVTATPEFVDAATLLPKRGAQAAAVPGPRKPPSAVDNPPTNAPSRP